MKLFTKFFTAIILTCTVQGAAAQEYKTGIGIRGGFVTPGLTVKHFIGESTCFEGILASRWRGYSFTGLIEKHQDGAFGVDQMDWYYGVGGHIASYDGYYYSYYKNGVYYVKEHTRVTAIGINGIIGLEYRFEEIPFTLSFDVMPYWDFVYRGTGFLDGALSFRYVF